jgi:large subunit ribosomal protein L4e
MAEVKVYGLNGKAKESIHVPTIFKIKPKLKIIQRTIEAHFARSKQPQGRDLIAGKRTTAQSWGTGYGIARVPRIKGSGFLTARNAGFIPYAKGGRLTHPPRAEKNMTKKVNKKEKTIALISSISASGNKNWILNRGHIIDEVPEIPLVIDDKIQTIKKTQKIVEVFTKLGLNREIDRVKTGKKIRAGKGKGRGHKYKNKKGILIVIKDDFGIYKAARNIPGVDVKTIESVSTIDFAPGGLPGRLVLWTQSAFNDLEQFKVMV